MDLPDLPHARVPSSAGASARTSARTSAEASGGPGAGAGTLAAPCPPRRAARARALVLGPALALLAACAGTPERPGPRTAAADAPPGPLEPAGTAGAAEVAEVPPGTRRAYFTAWPDELMQAAAEACDDPSQSVVRPTRDEVRCETLPAPEAAAALILGYGGTVEDLPRFVIAFTVAPRDAGFVVTAENYIRVPRRDAPALQVRLRDPVLGEGLHELLRAAGGTPV